MGRGDWSSESRDWDRGTAGLCGPLPQGTRCRVRAPASPLLWGAGLEQGDRAEASVWLPPREGLGVSSTAPSALAELSLCSPRRAWPLSRRVLPASRVGDVFPPCPRVGLIHARLYVRTCAGGRSRKGGEGKPPGRRGRRGGSAASCCWRLSACPWCSLQGLRC